MSTCTWGRKKWEAPRGANGLHYRLKTICIQASSSPGAGGCTKDAAGKTLEDLRGVGTTYLHLNCFATVHPRAAVFACYRHRSTQDAWQCCSHGLGARRCDEFPTPRVSRVSPQSEPLLRWWLGMRHHEIGPLAEFKAHQPSLALPALPEVHTPLAVDVDTGCRCNFRRQCMYYCLQINSLPQWTSTAPSQVDYSPATYRLRAPHFKP